MNKTMQPYIYYFALINLAIIDVVVIWHFAFILSDSYESEQIVVLDVLSLQISIFEMFFIVIGIVLAGLAIWGYQAIRNSISIEIKEQVERFIEARINQELNKRGYENVTADTSQTIMTSNKEEG